MLSYRTTVIRRAEIRPPSSPDPPNTRPPSQPSSEELVAILEEMTTLDSTLHGTAALLVYDDLESAQDDLVRVFGLTPGPCNETTTATLSTPKWYWGPAHLAAPLSGRSADASRYCP